MSDKEDQTNPELLAGLQQIKLQLGFAKPEPVVEEKTEENKVDVKPVIKEKDDDISTWPEEQLQVLAESESEMAKTAQAILAKRGVDAIQSEESKQIEGLRNDLKKDRNEIRKGDKAAAEAKADAVLQARFRNGEIAVMGEFLQKKGVTIPNGSLHGQFDTDSALESAKKIIEAENKANEAKRKRK